MHTQKEAGNSLKTLQFVVFTHQPDSKLMGLGSYDETHTVRITSRQNCASVLLFCVLTCQCQQFAQLSVGRRLAYLQEKYLVSVLPRGELVEALQRFMGLF